MIALWCCVSHTIGSAAEYSSDIRQALDVGLLSKVGVAAIGL
jgi:hypothetical protein